MTKGLLFDCDNTVANWAFDLFKLPKTKIDRALGVVDQEGKIIGAFLFQSWNGFNVELSYYGQNALTPGIIRCIAKFAVVALGVTRLTVHTSKRNRKLMHVFHRLGFRLEGTQRVFYGRRDCARNTSVRFVMFRDRLEQLALIPPQVEEKIC